MYYTNLNDAAKLVARRVNASSTALDDLFELPRFPFRVLNAFESGQLLVGPILVSAPVFYWNGVVLTTLPTDTIPDYSGRYSNFPVRVYGDKLAWASGGSSLTIVLLHSNR